jgi:tetratricopeptide (TPR) repeat protein
VRRVLVPVLLAAFASPVGAKPAAPVVAETGDFWREVIEPNGDQVKALIVKARTAMQQPDNAAITSDSDWAVDQRMRFYRDAFNLLRAARKLSPDNTEVLAMLGRAADEIGKTREAIDALEACVRVLGPDKSGTEVTGRLGAIYLRLGDRDAAVRWLRYAQGPINTTSVALVHLANALAARGEITAAIDTLQNAIGTQAIGYYGSDVTIVAFTLAVIYDRDEQRAAAFETLDHMQATLQQQYSQQLQNELGKLRFAPAEDQHYYLGLLYESLGHYTEARAEWALYAASGDSPWRGRALDHITSIDKQRRVNPTIKPTQITPGGRPPIVRPPRRP